MRQQILISLAITNGSEKIEWASGGQKIQMSSCSQMAELGTNPAFWLNPKNSVYRFEHGKQRIDVLRIDRVDQIDVVCLDGSAVQYRGESAHQNESATARFKAFQRSEKISSNHSTPE